MHKKLAAALLLPLLLAACGGSDDDDDDAPQQETPTAPAPETPAEEPPAPELDPVTEGSQATAELLGLAPIAGNSETITVYDVVADIGDTWRLTLDSQAGTYHIKPLQTQFGVGESSGTYTSTSSGEFFTTITGGDGAFVLLIDNRTRTIAGNMFVDGMLSTVSGTSYAVPADLSTLAGTYVFSGAARQLMDPMRASVGIMAGGDDYLRGTLMIRADATMVVCLDEQVTSEGNCRYMDGGEYTGSPARLERDADDGEVRMIVEMSDPALPEPVKFKAGVVRVHAGDRGPVLVLDLLPENGLTFYRSTGVVYAGLQTALKGNELDGAWQCAERGEAFATVQSTGSTVKLTSSDETETAAGTLRYNQVPTADGETFYDFNGVAALTTDIDETFPVTQLPLSSSLYLMQSLGGTSVVLCHLNQGDTQLPPIR
ncbi:hypothetical protein [Bordetella genomosp. 13]|uniref:Lipoprotein n=1 Tax=Bordetella genomosp. 13 TaxID=463040 RepID=A0A1W6ZF02_9BORD|nr:hypothetical protein [Bordetella genomosp. 13]ARP95842.1 hypothetical protein CAL15_16525 [Bordetella genomosp. 13]